ncbi:MAG: glutathione S-transferase family protein [Pseudomonadota bacterium]
MTATISALGWAPDFARGFVKDLRVRWALEEAGLPYAARLVDPGASPDDPYRDWQPFGQVPAYREGDVEMFESGAIVLHIAARSEALAPSDAQGRARAWSWVFAALTTLQPQVDNRNHLRAHLGEDMRATLDGWLETRLDALERRLRTRDHLENRFTVGDLMMTTVLRELREDGTLGAYATLLAYTDRCEARPAFRRALDAQFADFRDDL